MRLRNANNYSTCMTVNHILHKTELSLSVLGVKIVANCEQAYEPKCQLHVQVHVSALGIHYLNIMHWIKANWHFSSTLMQPNTQVIIRMSLPKIDTNTLFTRSAEVRWAHAAWAHAFFWHLKPNINEKTATGVNDGTGSAHLHVESLQPLLKSLAIPADDIHWPWLNNSHSLC